MGTDVTIWYTVTVHEGQNVISVQYVSRTLDPACLSQARSVPG